MASASIYIEKMIAQYKVVLFSKTVCAECQAVKDMLSKLTVLRDNDNYKIIEIEKRTDCSEFHDYLWKLADRDNRQVPMLFINGSYFGCYEDIVNLRKEKKLLEAIKKRMTANDPVVEEEDIIFTIAEIDHTDIIVQLVDTCMSTGSYTDTLAFEEDRPCLPRGYQLDAWHAGTSDLAHEMGSFMDSETADLKMMRTTSFGVEP